MTPSLKRKLTIGAVAGSLACLAGGGAYAATQSSNSKAPSTDPQQAFLNDVAGRLHVSVADLQAALKGAAADRIDAAAKAGRLTQAQADAIKKKLQQGAGVPFFAPFAGGPRGLRGPLVKPFAGPFERPFGPAAPPRLLKAGLDAASKYLGLTHAQIRRQVASGQTLAEIAKARGKSADGLTSAIEDAVKARLDAAVGAKKLTQAQETKILAFADELVAKVVNGKLPAGPPRFFERRFHRGP